MIVIIPMQSQRALPQRIIDVYEAQSEKAEIVTIGVPSQKSKAIRLFEAKTRHVCNMVLSGCSDGVVCMSDSDCLHLVRTNLEEAKNEISCNPQLGGVAFSQNDIDNLEQAHVDIKSFVIRSALLKLVDWLSPTVKMCLCYKIKEVLQKNGFLFRYIDCRKRIMAI